MKYTFLLLLLLLSAKCYSEKRNNSAKKSCAGLLPHTLEHRLKLLLLQLLSIKRISACSWNKNLPDDSVGREVIKRCQENTSSGRDNVAKSQLKTPSRRAFETISSRMRFRIWVRTTTCPTEIDDITKCFLLVQNEQNKFKVEHFTERDETRLFSRNFLFDFQLKSS